MISIAIIIVRTQCDFSGDSILNAERRAQNAEYGKG